MYDRKRTRGSQRKVPRAGPGNCELRTPEFPDSRQHIAVSAPGGERCLLVLPSSWPTSCPNVYHYYLIRVLLNLSSLSRPLPRVPSHPILIVCECHSDGVCVHVPDLAVLSMDVGAAWVACDGPVSNGGGCKQLLPKAPSRFRKVTTDTSNGSSQLPSTINHPSSTQAKPSCPNR